MRRFTLCLSLLALIASLIAVRPSGVFASINRHPNHPADYPYPHVHSLVRDPANEQHIFALGNPDA